MKTYYKIITKTIFFLFLSLGTFNAFSQKSKSITDTLRVNGACLMCKQTIENTALDLGTTAANWDIESKTLVVTYRTKNISKAIIEKKLASVGYDAGAEKANLEVYNSLPDCCHYDRTLDLSQTNFGGGSSMDSIAKNQIQGIVVLKNENKEPEALVNASIGYNNKTALTDNMGRFSITGTFPMQLQISYTGMKPKLVTIKNSGFVQIELLHTASDSLAEVVVTSIKKQAYHLTTTLNTVNLGSQELTKAACCNLSESFETSPSVDVSYADALTGIKQIELLGLSGKYIQLLTEGIPEIRGLSGNMGLTFIPGPWIKSIQLTKGSGSVMYGFESIAGQINAEEIKPDDENKLFLNTYVNQMGRLESSIYLTKKINPSVSTALLLHANGAVQKNDFNQDGFLDMPLGKQFNVMNRWKIANKKGLFAQFAVKALNDYRQTGQTQFTKADKYGNATYGAAIDVHQYQLSGKLGYVFSTKRYQSIGSIFSAIDFENNSYFGTTKYNGKQKSAYVNVIFQNGNDGDKNVFKTGLSFMLDKYNETFKSVPFARKEAIPGAFFEYTFTKNKLTSILGLRQDFHNQYKAITTTRLNLKYDFTKKTSLRFSTGSGFKVANIFAENSSVFISSRAYTIVNPTNQYGYGLNPEKTWNYGINFTQNFTAFGRKGSFSLDAYQTDFIDQVVTDLDKNPQEVLFYNLTGKSFSRSLIGELNFEPIKNLQVRMAYRYLDAQTDYWNGRLQKPLQAKNRAFLNLAYETKNKWKFDITAQWLSKKRIPNTSANPTELQMPSYSPAYTQLNAQISKTFAKNIDVYLGGENLTNYTQKRLILDTENPFGKYFDASLTWGPVIERVIYLGLRFKIK